MSQSYFDFMGVPPEMREMIYDRVFDRHLDSTVSILAWACPDPALCLVSKFMYNESRKTYQRSCALHRLDRFRILRALLAEFKDPLRRPRIDGHEHQTARLILNDLCHDRLTIWCRHKTTESREEVHITKACTDCRNTFMRSWRAMFDPSAMPKLACENTNGTLTENGELSLQYIQSYGNRYGPTKDLIKWLRRQLYTQAKCAIHKKAIEIYYNQYASQKGPEYSFKDLEAIEGLWLSAERSKVREVGLALSEHERELWRREFMKRWGLDGRGDTGMVIFGWSCWLGG